jgi:GNAT superfamily N-acetyltransferase
MAVDIQPVRSRAEREAFIRFPFSLYADDPDWVPPLLSQQRRFLDPARNPFFDHAEVALWLAVRDGRVVGTISSHIDHRHNQVHVHARRDGMFGFFECVDDCGVALAYRQLGLEGWLIVELTRRGIERGYQAADLSWIAEDNLAMRRLVEHVYGPFGVRVHRTYRLYEMPLHMF